MPYRIIVADPSPSVQKAAQLVFVEPEYRLTTFDDGAALLDGVASVEPDAILISLSLPGRDGYEVGRTLRSRPELQSVPLIALKGAFEGLDTDRIVPPEYDEVVLKPFDSERLAAAVRDLITRKTGPATLPEEPAWPEPAAGAAEGQAPSDAGGPPAPGPFDASVKAWVREELVGMEREIEKRVRARVVTDLKEWMSGDGQGSGPKE